MAAVKVTARAETGVQSDASIFETLRAADRSGRSNARVRLALESTGVPKTIDDGIASIPPKILGRHLYAGRGLPTLVFGEIQQPLDFLDGFSVVPFRDNVGKAHFFLDQAAQN